MRLVVVGPVYPYRGGIAHYTSQLILALQERGHQVKVISFRRQYPASLYPGASDKDPSQSPLKSEAEFLLDPLYPWTWRRATARIIGYAPDLVVFQWWTTFWAFSFAQTIASLRRHNIKTITIVHNVLPHERRPWDKALAWLALSQGQPLIAQNQYEKEHLQTLIPNAQISVCPHPIYPRFNNQLVSKTVARQKLNLPAEIPMLLFFGIVRPYKGLHILLEAISQLRKQEIKPLLIIAGEFWENKRTYIEQIDALQLSEQVRIVDRYLPNEDVDLYYSAADALVAPYIGGTQSGAAALAMGYGLPIVLTKQIAAGIPEGYNERIKVVEEGDKEGLALAILETLEHPIQHQTLLSTVQAGWDSLVNILEEEAQ